MLLRLFSLLNLNSDAMAKRFTDSGKWKKKWFRKLPSEMKLLWIYLCDNCDHAGIFEVDFERISFDLGIEFNEYEEIEITVIDFFDGRIEEFNQGEKWFLRGFLDFQYGPFNEKNRVHISANNILIKYNLTWNKEGDIKPLISPLQGAKDKDTDKDKDKDEDRGIVKGDFERPIFAPKNIEIIIEYFVTKSDKSEKGINQAKTAAESFWEEYESTNWKYKGSDLTNWRNRANSWLRNWILNEKKKPTSNDKNQGLILH